MSEKSRDGGYLKEETVEINKGIDITKTGLSQRVGEEVGESRHKDLEQYARRLEELKDEVKRLKEIKKQQKKINKLEEKRVDVIKDIEKKKRQEMKMKKHKKH